MRISRSGSPDETRVHLHAHLRDWRLHKCVVSDNDENVVEWQEGEWLELPIRQIVAQRAGHVPAEFEFFLNRVDDRTWQSPRSEWVRRSVDQIVLKTMEGIPFLAPEIQLHYKAKRHREKDEHDFRVALDGMSMAQKMWLKEALLVYKADDPWIGVL